MMNLNSELLLRINFSSIVHTIKCTCFTYRIQQQMSNQCFEMAVQLNAGTQQGLLLPLNCAFKYTRNSFNIALQGKIRDLAAHLKQREACEFMIFSFMWI